jgi:hypothetical protein
MSSHSRNVWFPVAEDGEPVERNPDDGCGGALFKLNYIREFDKDKPVTSMFDAPAAVVSWVGRSIKTIPENTTLPPPPPPLMDLLTVEPWPWP